MILMSFINAGLHMVACFFLMTPIYITIVRSLMGFATAAQIWASTAQVKSTDTKIVKAFLVSAIGFLLVHTLFVFDTVWNL